MRCLGCLGVRRGCSFKDADFGIKSWPEVVSTPESIARKAKDTAKKKNANKPGNTVKAPEPSAMSRSISEGSVVVVPRRTTKGAGSLIASSSQHIASDDVESVVEKPSPPSYREERIPFVDLGELEAAVKLPGRTPNQVKAALADISSIREREVTTVNRLTKLATSRSEIYTDLLLSLERDLRGLLREERERANRELLAPDEEDEIPSDGSVRGRDKSEYED